MKPLEVLKINKNKFNYKAFRGYVTLFHRHLFILCGWKLHLDICIRDFFYSLFSNPGVAACSSVTVYTTLSEIC